MTSMYRPLRNNLLLLEVDVKIKSEKFTCTVPARFVYNWQTTRPVWVEVHSREHLIPFAEEVELSSSVFKAPFQGVASMFKVGQSAGEFSHYFEILPMVADIESAPVSALDSVTFALLDEPLGTRRPVPQGEAVVLLRCGEFEVVITQPTKPHSDAAEVVGSTPHYLSDSGVLRRHDGKPFASTHASSVLRQIHDILSFAAGRWVGITLVEGRGVQADMLCPGIDWFRWGTTPFSGTPRVLSWYHPDHPEWLQEVSDGFLKLTTDAAEWETVKAALYWYIRSNTRGAGLDSSLILTQCALELLSWLVIVKKTGALSEEGYGQLGNAAERLRLAMTLLGIPRRIPAEQVELSRHAKDWGFSDLADAIVKGRNYLVHPTQSRRGKRREKREYPWLELWTVGQWLLELMLLALLGYTGGYTNRTTSRPFRTIDRVPWA